MYQHSVDDLYRYLGSCYAQFSKSKEVHAEEKERYNQVLATAVAQNKAISVRLSALEERDKLEQTAKVAGPVLVEDTDQDS